MVGVLLTLTLAAWAGQPCTLSAPLQRAERALLELDVDAAQEALDAARADLTCGANEPDELAAFWLLHAALRQVAGDEQGADAALRAARRTDATVFVEALGPAIRSRWASLDAATGEASLRITDLPEGYTLRLDGREVEPGTLALAPGVSVVQARAGDIGWGRVVRAQAGDAIELTTGLPAAPAAPEPPAPVDRDQVVSLGRSRERAALSVYAGLGFGMGLGERVGDEPATKVGPGVELGVWLRAGPRWWARVFAGGDLLVGGRWAWFESDGSARGLPLAPSLVLGAGLTVHEGLDVGVQAGAKLPGRVPVRGLGALALGGGFAAEVRLGVDVGTPTADGLRLEPAGTAVLTYER